MNHPEKVEKPFSPSCERNQSVLLEVLKQHLRTDDKQVLEIGSGTGQHAVFFAENLPALLWQTSDIKANHAGIQLWLDEANLNNVQSPIEYEIGKDQWPDIKADLIFSANTLHIIPFEWVKLLIQSMGQNLRKGALVMFYGPFKYQGEFTSASNADFDLWLKDIDPLRGVRDFETIVALMDEQRLPLRQDINMPANNQMLIFERL
ncbi:DUF938 domain-containing protein [Marinicella litoralis]|uniref:Uncharacterized protein DUF938 n=1 Tax=Marinicella litoralis TaxID=644220 RepID=A0A4V3DIM5_9GAMM|nr:DUF938 domain-containing protein [Marinicella litoralis]TDR22641.1 uncharacterized protein DUF938 [Marinicella litoralis]